jgi:2-iminoacetate synthase
MSFQNILNKTDLTHLKEAIYAVSEEKVAATLKKRSFVVSDFPVLVSPAASAFLETMADIARRTTLLRFGRTVKLYAPLYISNQCINACKYCGFSINNPMKRVTLSIDEVCREAEALYRQGFRHILLVTGEDPRTVGVSYLAEIALELSRTFAAVNIEVYPMETADYKTLAQSGVSGIALYQETYDRPVYGSLHRGPKADFDFRLATNERAAAAGFRELGIGALLGLSDFRLDMTCVAMHGAYLMKHFWKSQVAVSFPRLQHAAGSFKPTVTVTDRDLAQVIFALRMVLPDADLVLSTLENPDFRNGMAGLGITRMSAGSKTNPGGYTFSKSSLEQFEIADRRSPAEIAAMLEAKKLEPVWKDFDRSFLFDRTTHPQ